MAYFDFDLVDKIVGAITFIFCLINEEHHTFISILMYLSIKDAHV